MQTSVTISLFAGGWRIRRTDGTGGAFLLRHRYFRGVVLGLMLFLAGTAFCTSDSYDPNPYDDIPPVVTVEFNYVVPGQVGHALVRTAFKNDGLHALGYVERHQVPSVSLGELDHEQISFLFLPDTPETFAPLRR